MTDAYDDWQEARKRLDANPADAFLTNVEQTLRPLAIHALCERLVGEGWSYDDEVVSLDESEVATFLADLDQLRGTPKSGEVEREVSKMRVAVDSALAGMARLNYTGDHTHFEVLEDAQYVLNEVLHGRPFPKLERFRCPSRRKARNNKVQCEHQLPHEGFHFNAKSGESWTDEQSLNPPVPYVDGVQDLCPCVLLTAGGSVRCSLPAGHGPDHRAETGMTWHNDYDPEADKGSPVKTAVRCPEWHNAGEMLGRCEKIAGHDGPHLSLAYNDQQDSSFTWWAAVTGACDEQHVLTENDGGAETVHCSMYKDHAGPSHFDVRSGSSWPVS
jgi:hypothetical protein